MTNQLETAIIEFLANEFKLKTANISQDTSFTTDLGLSAGELQDLFQRLQDSLNIILPEDKLSQVNTIADLLEITRDEEPPED